ncbi:methionine ABC transporter permease [Peribacillus sp. B-H-3]|jgi:D-methionine transport system permease protein|uniref:methionine ABC transporter permease n=1 Tax=Bacillaceae TaxID=186817 RepID=UPI0008F1EF41|nr:methionine ABC transporter permease [Bacillus sp. OV322]SFC96989.1 D-methionine transport system permease protein [Bacillus sp. OV322]
MELNWEFFWPQFFQACEETFLTVFGSFIFGTIIGLPLGIILVITRPGHIMENKAVFLALNTIVNIVRSVPFIILLVAIIPFTRLVTGTSIGVAAAIVPLSIFVGPYLARLIENSMLEVDKGVLETAHAMGATKMQIITKFIIPEAVPSLILSFTTATIGLIGSTAAAGAVGAGGLGNLAITYGYQRFITVVIVITVVLLIVSVQLIQSFGNTWSRYVRRKRG